MDDLVAFNKYHHAHSPTLRRQMYGPAILAGLAAVAFALIELLKPSPRGSTYWPSVVLLLLAAAGYPAFHRFWLSRTVRAMFSEGSLEPFLGKKEVSMTPVEIVETGATRSTTVRWPCVQRVVQNQDVLYVYISATEAIVLPRRSFADEAAFTAFFASARQYWESCRPRIDKA